MRIRPVFLGLVLMACYQYVPSPAQPATGDEVRFTLSNEATVSLAPVLGPRTTALTGRILSDGPSEFALAVDRTFKDDGVAVVWGRDRVSIPRGAITRTERRVLDRTRTLIATGGVVLGATVTALILSKYRSNASSSNGGVPPPPPPP
jgi:hypothetical protein